MKKLFLLPLFFLFFINPAGIFSQSEVTSMQDILETLNGKVINLEEEKHMEIVHMTIDLLVGTNSKSVYRKLDPTYVYTLSVFGDRRISKLKVTVYKKGKKEWEFVNELSSSSPQMTLTPLEYDNFEITVTVEDYKGTNNVGHFAVMLYHLDPAYKK
jgi:hypothetical protein